MHTCMYNDAYMHVHVCTSYVTETVCSTCLYTDSFCSHTVSVSFNACVYRLSELVSPPTAVREMDWINVHWPNDLPEDYPHTRPRVCSHLHVYYRHVCVHVYVLSPLETALYSTTHMLHCVNW